MRPIYFTTPSQAGAAATRALAVLCALAAPAYAADNFLVHNLVSDIPGMADRTDPNLVNPWGNGFSASSPFWIGNNHSGTSTLYDTTGAPLSLVVSIPSPSGQAKSGAVTGVLFNSNPGAFNVASGKPASFVFCTEDGTIAGWNSSVDATNAKIMIDNSKAGAIYKGCAFGGTSTAPLLYAANFNSGKIDVWDANLAPVQNASAFVNAKAPAGFAPFNIENLAGKLYVTYAKQDSDKHDDVPGAGNGYVAVFDMSGALQSNLISGGPLNSPWGMAMAPSSFGDFSSMLLVGNFGDGKINAFDPSSGALKGTLADTKGNTISIQGLWSLNFGNGGRGGDSSTLYFTAGIGGNGEDIESHGLFGSIQPGPSFQTSGVVNGASFRGTIAANSWVSILGGALSATTRTWRTSDFNNNNLPTQLDGVAVKVNGESAFISYVSPSQVNFLVPGDLTPGPVQVTVTNNGLTSSTGAATLSADAPAFFVIGTNATTKDAYIAATHADNSLIGPPGLITNVTTTPAKAGETVVLYGTGFGATTPAIPSGQTVSAAAPLTTMPLITIGGIPAKVTFAGIVAPGLDQINVIVPDGIAPGTTQNIDVPVLAQIGSDESAAHAVITIVNPAGQ